MARRAFFLAFLIQGAIPVSGSAQAPSAEQIEFFEKRIRPLFVNKCFACHSQEAKKLRGDLYLDSRDGTRLGGKRGPIFVAGKPEESRLIQAVRQTGELKMPPGGKLTDAEIADLEAWVKMGAPDPRGDKIGKAPSIDEGKKFWSLRPLEPVRPPAVKDKAWPLNPIDQFILAKLEEKGLAPVKAADKLTLIRRATFDLIGLPPTPEEIDAFLKDSAADAYAKLIDRLLASPHYGERWGRHWLDVVRYADTAGDNSDYPIPQMYLYRNWVVDAFNKDIPYDQLIVEQLAGDLLPSKSDAEAKARLIATGYLANSRRHGSYEDARYPWHLTIEDTIDNLGKTFLGTTIHCARCHDHKFDPFSADDYYALYGFFSSTRYPWPGIELDRVQHDLVPLAAAEEVAKAKGERNEALAKMDDAIKHQEAEAAELATLLKSAGAEDKAKLTMQVDASNKALTQARKEREALAKMPLPLPMAYAIIDGKNEPKKRIGQVGNAKVQLKGDPDRLGKEVPRRFPTILGGMSLPPEAKGSGRLELAKWLADPENPLTARVMVNRIWLYHFGRGLVATPNDFGKLGQRPSHPELLDYLADYFQSSALSPAGERGEGDAWSIKKMHRLIMLSRTYQLASTEDEAIQKIDPSNELLSHYPRRRLDAEAIRDALLAISGNLDRSPGGPHPFPEMKKWDFTQHKPFKAVYDTNRRSVYLMTQRIQRHPFLALFDGPDTNASTATRPISTTPLQALFLMNNPFVHEQARAFAGRLIKECAEEGTRIERAFLYAFGRPPTDEERQQSREFLTSVREKLVETPMAEREARAWQSFARAVFMSNEFVYAE